MFIVDHDSYFDFCNLYQQKTQEIVRLKNLQYVMKGNIWFIIQVFL